jgi:hypothetical protein
MLTARNARLPCDSQTRPRAYLVFQVLAPQLAGVRLAELARLLDLDAGGQQQLHHRQPAALVCVGVRE